MAHAGSRKMARIKRTPTFLEERIWMIISFLIRRVPDDRQTGHRIDFDQSGTQRPIKGLRSANKHIPLKKV
jgi:hypothetical protein